METKSLDQIKTADTEYPLHELIRRRWSPRAFSERPVDRERLRQLFDAARWAPSSYNEQPWRFIVATPDEKGRYGRIASVMNEGNRKWAYGAPVLGLTVVRTTLEKNGKPNRMARHDLGQAMAYLTMEALRHDIYVHQMGGIQPGRGRELFRIPDDFEPVTMFALGYRGDPEQLPESRKRSEHAVRSRKPIDEIAFRGDWEERERL